MQGHGRGARMKIEQDRIEWLAGVRAGETIGSPVAMLIPNRDWANWEDVMAAEWTPATSWNGPAPGKPRHGWRRGRWPGGCWRNSASRSAATLSRWEG